VQHRGQTTVTRVGGTGDLISPKSSSPFGGNRACSIVPMGTRGWLLIGSASGALLAYFLAPQPLLLAGVAGAFAITWWLITLDWWQRFYVLTLLLTIGATSSIDVIVSAANSGRYVAVFGLLMVTWFATRNIEPRVTGLLHRRVVGTLWLIVAGSELHRDRHARRHCALTQHAALDRPRHDAS
jgi:hypothetical protein